MKPLTIVGIILAALGAVILLRGLSFGTQRSVLKIGDVQVSAEEQHTIPTWVGGVAVVGGLLLAGAGMSGRRNA